MAPGCDAAHRRSACFPAVTDSNAPPLTVGCDLGLIGFVAERSAPHPQLG